MKPSNDVNKPIINLQRALRRISYANKNIPTIVPDGIYGPQTVQAVKAFQNEFDLPNTGETNNATWDKIMEEYAKTLDIYTEAKTLDVFPSPFFTVKIDDDNDIVLFIQSILFSLSKRFSNILPSQVTGIFDNMNSNNIKVIQKATGLSETGIVDKPTWDMLAAIFESNVSKNRTTPYDKDSEHIIKRDLTLYSPINNDDYRL